VSPDLRGLLFVALASLSLLPAGCSDEEAAAPAPPPAALESRKARVRFKGITRLQNDLSQALSLPVQELCTELGSSSCAEVHRIALGGVMPYTRGIHEPLPLRSVSNAAAVDRLVLSACARRAELDFGGTPVLFGALVAGVDDDAAGKTAHALYNAVLRRDETAEERAAIVAFAAEQKQKGTSARDLATTTCYAVGTSVEALFY
jgi:hypothetical protein